MEKQVRVKGAEFIFYADYDVTPEEIWKIIDKFNKEMSNTTDREFFIHVANLGDKNLVIEDI